MCNCGKKRMEYSQSSQKMNISAGNTGTSQNSGSYSFEYTGKTALTLKGSVTGTQYRFSYTGNRQNIDPRDIPGIINIPALKRV